MRCALLSPVSRGLTRMHPLTAGNGTLIGASANIACAGVAQHQGYRISFADFFKIGFPVMLVSVAAANIYLVICFVAFDWS